MKTVISIIIGLVMIALLPLRIKALLHLHMVAM